MRTPKKTLRLPAGEVLALLETHLKETCGVEADVLRVDAVGQVSKDPFNVFPGNRHDPVFFDVLLDEPERPEGQPEASREAPPEPSGEPEDPIEEPPAPVQSLAIIPGERKKKRSSKKKAAKKTTEGS